jgi:hypothetical protein
MVSAAFTAQLKLRPFKTGWWSAAKAAPLQNRLVERSQSCAVSKHDP